MTKKNNLTFTVPLYREYSEWTRRFWDEPDTNASASSETQKGKPEPSGGYQESDISKEEAVQVAE